MRWSSSGENINRAFELIKMFNRGPVTVKDVQDKWGVDRRTVWKWITIMSLHFPIYDEWIPNPHGSGNIKLFRLLR